MSSQSKDRQEWISVEDRLPDYGVVVFAYNSNWGDSIGVFSLCEAEGEDEGGNSFSGYGWANHYGCIDSDGEFDDDYNITHWMPLPSPPEVKDEL